MDKPIVLWKGYHGPEIRSLATAAWNGELTLVCFPPAVDDVSFVPFLPKGPVTFRGEWEETPPLSGAAGSRAPAYPDAPMIGLFSSGTVGRKLVLASKANVAASLDAILSEFAPERLGAIFCYPQPFHTFGLVLGYLHAARHGRELVTATGPYGSSQHDLRQRLRRPDLLTLGTPTHFHDWLGYVRAHGERPSPSYAAIVGGAPITPELWGRIQDELAIEAPSVGYGATEACPGVTHLPPGQRPIETGEIGYPLPHLAVERLPGRGLAFSGPSTCLAVIRGENVELPERVVLTDDVVRRDDGVWIYRGRFDHVLNRGGEKFPLAALEEALRGRLGIEAVCVALPDERLGEELGVVAKTDERSRARVYDVLFDVCRREFDPSRFRPVDELPRTDNAKIDRDAATRLFRESP